MTDSLPQSAVVTVERAGASYGTKAILRDISLTLSAGEILCVVGRSGCGKSTLLNLLSGLAQPSQGKVEVRATLAIVPQTDLLLPWRTVLENAYLPIEIRNELSENQVAGVRRQLHSLGLRDCEDLFPHQLSGGMRQKVSIARALAQDAEVLLFDEPFSALDFDARLKAGKDLRTLIKARSKSVVFVTHNIEEAISLGDRVLVLGGFPARICFETVVEIDEDFRDPVNVRKTQAFPELFEKIWRSLGEGR